MVIMTFDSSSIIPQICSDLSTSLQQTRAILELLEAGNTIPFIARYRKEAIGGVDEVVVRSIKERFDYLVELNERRQAILTSIEQQGKLTDELREKINGCMVKNELEDLYLPYKPKRRTKAMIAREKGLEPLALRLMEQSAQGNPEVEAAVFVDAEKGVNSVEEALEGARHIAAEIVSEKADVRALVREAYMTQGMVVSKVREEFADQVTKFDRYYDFRELMHKIPSHRYLAIRRGEKEGVLSMCLELESAPVVAEILRRIGHKAASPFGTHLVKAVEDAYKRLLLPSVETDLHVDLKMNSDRSAVDVFAQNLRTLLLSAPAGRRAVIGIDPGVRTGCKCAAIAETGKYLDTVTIYLSQGDQSLTKAKVQLLAFVEKYKPWAIAVGNGTAGRETEAFVRQLLVDSGETDIVVVQVNEAGASVYSASDVAREEFPDLDLTIRGAISIARRLQDPLAELVKVEPKAIGVGQYQHDVYQPLLEAKLGEVVESCVNHVGVELNTASAPLLSYVAGIGLSLAKKIVTYREEHGRFESRKELTKVPGLGPKTFEQAAGFLRIRGAANPLDASAVHPERYGLVETIAKEMNLPLAEIVGNASAANGIDIRRYVSQEVGELTLKDIIEELKKPGRDPRETFEPPKFREDVHSIADLKVGMILEGVVTNVTAFGAFVDIGVHQDGLVHISQLASKFVKDPSDVVKTGDKIKVKVLEADANRKRISLTARLDEAAVQTLPTAPRGAAKAAPRKSFSNNPFSSL
jgi:uncharacterized protein